MTYISGLEDLIELKKQHPEYEIVLHGSVLPNCCQISLGKKRSGLSTIFSS